MMSVSFVGIFVSAASMAIAAQNMARSANTLSACSSQ